MGLAVTHVLITIVALDILRHYVFGKKKFPRYWVVVGGIAGLFPDFDIPISWFVNAILGSQLNFHGSFTHSFIFPLVFIVFGIIFHLRKETTWAGLFYVIGGSWGGHILIDCAFGGIDKVLFWPISLLNFCPAWDTHHIAAGIDAALLVLWLIHEEVHKRIRDYI